MTSSLTDPNHRVAASGQRMPGPVPRPRPEARVEPASWSTRELAELAGTTLKAVRHYHEVGLLEQPERAPNGYKRYGVGDLVRLLRIRRLVELGVPLAQVAAVGSGEGHPEEALRELDADLDATIERLVQTRTEIAAIMRHRAPADLPPGFSAVGAHLSDADHALVLVCSKVFDPVVMTSLRELLHDDHRRPVDTAFENLPADADEDTRARLAEQMVQRFAELAVEYPWLHDPGAHAPRGRAFARRTMRQAMAELYNPAQLDVVRRFRRLRDVTA